MKMRMTTWTLAFGTAATVFTVACGGGSTTPAARSPQEAAATAAAEATRSGNLLGAPPPAEIERVPIREIVANPAAYKDRTIAVEGFTGNVGCVDCGGITLVEGVARLLVEPADPSRFMIPLRIGARVSTWGRLHVEGGHEEEHEEGESHEDPPDYSTGTGTETSPSGVYVELKAEGVEFR